METSMPFPALAASQLFSQVARWSHEGLTTFLNIRPCASNRDEYAGSNHEIDGLNVRVPFLYRYVYLFTRLNTTPREVFTQISGLSWDIEGLKFSIFRVYDKPSISRDPHLSHRPSSPSGRGDVCAI